MKRNIIALILVFSLLMSFAACRKLEDTDAFVVESKVYVVDEHGVEQKVETDLFVCDNPRCISSTEQELPHKFKCVDAAHGIYRCIYCEAKKVLK